MHEVATAGPVGFAARRDHRLVLTPDRLRILVGIDPQQYRQYAAMRGDTSDSLVGIHGIGETTAVKIRYVFGSVEAAFADVDINDGQRVAAVVGKAVVTKLATPESREAFWRNVEIMTMRTDMNLGIALDAPFGEALLPLSPDELFHALHAVELHSLQNMARELLATSPMIAGTFAATALPPDRGPGSCAGTDTGRCTRAGG